MRERERERRGSEQTHTRKLWGDLVVEDVAALQKDGGSAGEVLHPADVAIVRCVRLR